VRATARTRRVPFSLTMRSAQVWEDGVVRELSVRMRGRARPARAEVEHAVPSALSAWLAPGTHLAILISGRQDVSAPRPAGGVDSVP
jgi:hypothetical protein